MTTRLKEGVIALPAEVLARAGLAEGDEVYVDVDANGAVVVERTRTYESGEEFLAAIRARIDEG
ncbi:MAG: hypothetical protein GEU88_17275 [Solirubrobacterales bacterium]|nr:hypothetical protein [Solirubrobacterales bacterium]